MTETGGTILVNGSETIESFRQRTLMNQKAPFTHQRRPALRRSEKHASGRFGKFEFSTCVEPKTDSQGLRQHNASGGIDLESHTIILYQMPFRMVELASERKAV
jgi:hypothetical protein